MVLREEAIFYLKRGKKKKKKELTALRRNLPSQERTFGWRDNAFVFKDGNPAWAALQPSETDPISTRAWRTLWG